MNNYSFLKRITNFLQSKNARSNKKTIHFTLIFLSIWLVLVVYTETQHEFWRDEVRAFSLVQEIQSPSDFYNLLQYEGHPFLWYVLLFIGKSIINTPLWLPILGVSIAFLAVCLFMFYAPFPLWTRLLFLFSSISLYEYSVMARNYGISMLLLFVIAILYKKRFSQPYPLALALFFLANTNVHSLIFVGLICLVWVWDFFRNQRPLTFKKQLVFLYLPLLIVFVGIVLCLVYIYPKENSILVTNNINLEPLVIIKTLLRTITESNTTFSKLFPESFPGWITILVLPLMAVGLMKRPAYMLAAFGAQTLMGATFLLVYSGKFRHQALYVVFIVFLYWLFLDSLKNKKITGFPGLAFKVGYSAFTVLLIGNVFLNQTTVWKEITTPASASKQFGEFLANSPEYNNAIILAEPDYMMESLPYYVNNKIYIPREQRFGKTVSWANDAETSLSLGELIQIGEALKQEYEQPVLITIGHWDINLTEPGEEIYSYNKIFTWNEADIQAFQTQTEFIIEFTPAFTGEKYRVYHLK
ncbi:MAG: hypothetical protein CL609_15000 [Anaerolineaceae bacterium]|nr:hypothetical protein [Anaerolineaceae bacterium]